MSSESPSSIRFHGVIPIPPLAAAAIPVATSPTASAASATSGASTSPLTTWAEPSQSQSVSPLSRGRSVCGSGHVHGPDCGHTQIQHIDHIGYLHDGRLHCMVNQQCVEHKLVDDVDSCLPGRKLSIQKQGCNDHGHSHGHSHGAQQPVPVPVAVAVSTSVHGHTHATDDDHDHDHTPNHDHHHDHSDTCGHELIMHGDHYDYLVGSQLHHVGDGQCQVHGSLRKRNLTYIEVSSIDDEKSKPRVSRRHEMLLEKQALLRRGDSKPHKERWYDNRDSRRFAMMVGLTGSYFLVELIFGIYLSSLALVADAMHMLSDLMALIFGFYAVEAAKRERTAKSTYGGSRWEVVGGLSNGAFLLGLCFTIVIEAITRFTEPINEELEKEGTTIIIVAGVGLGINLIGMIIFGHGHGHGHSHGGHGHSHGGHGGHGGHDDGHAHGHDEHEDDHDRLELGTSKKQSKPMNVNVHGAFLHIMGDALGSIGVLISGLIVQYTTYENRTLADPAASLIIALLIVSSTIPLLRICCNVLLQQTPHDMNTEQIRQQLRSIQGVLQIHELHIWQLTTVKIVATMHVVLYEGTNFMNVCDEMKLLMHAAGVHSTTIQPEFIPKSKCLSHTSGSMDLCHEPVCGASDCFEKACCIVQPITAA